MTKPIDAKYTALFADKSAVNATHIHGAVDIGAPIGTPILAPEDGFIFGWQAIRYKDGQYWPESPKAAGYDNFAFKNMFYDMYGGCTFLESKDSMRTHIFCHSYGNQIFNKVFHEVDKRYVEQKADDRFPIFAFYTLRQTVKEGDVIGYVGHSGTNFGSHLHWEMHQGLNNRQTYTRRINPRFWLEGVN